MQSALRSRLSRADVLAEVIREVNSTLDPERVADAIVARAAQWLPAPAWVVYAVDNAGVRTFGEHGLSGALEPAAVAKCVGAGGALAYTPAAGAPAGAGGAGNAIAIGPCCVVCSI